MRGAASIALSAAAITGADVEECVGGTFLFEENARRAHAAASMGKPIWIDEKLAADAGGELLKSRGPFKRVWALVESDHEQEQEQQRQQ